MKATLVIVAVSGLLTKPSYLYRVGAQEPSIMKVEPSGQQQQLLPDAENTSLNLSRSLLENNRGHTNYRTYRNASQEGPSSERVETTISSQTAHFLFQEPLNIVAVTYNSANDFTNMMRALVSSSGILDQGPANVALVCTQEAKQLIATNTMYEHVLRDTGWQFLKSCRHRGATDAGINWQELAILVKLPSGWVPESNFVESHDCPWSTWPSWNPELVGVRDINTNTTHHIEVNMVCTRTSALGKGGLVGTLKLPMQRGQLTLVAGCAHLDAYSKDERDKNVKQFVELMDRKAASDKRFAQVLLGDLNNRIPIDLFEDGSETAVANLILEHLIDYRQSALRKLDVLGSRVPDVHTPFLIQPKESRGYEFSCNDPGTQIPTYKLKDQEFCQKLRKLTQKELEDKTYCENLIGQCYLRKQPSDQPWPNQKYSMAFCSPRVYPFKQLGWLDRVCWKANTGVSVEEIHSFAADQRPALEEAVLQGQTPEDFSDHGPSLVLMKISFKE